MTLEEEKNIPVYLINVLTCLILFSCKFTILSYGLVNACLWEISFRLSFTELCTVNNALKQVCLAPVTSSGRLYWTAFLTFACRSRRDLWQGHDILQAALLNCRLSFLQKKKKSYVIYLIYSCHTLSFSFNIQVFKSFIKCIYCTSLLQFQLIRICLKGKFC